MNAKAFATGVLTGIVAASAVTMMTDHDAVRSARKLKKNTTRFFRNIGAALDTMIDMRK
ncbi:MAG: hypothetical protein GX196_03105 [Clostridiaceae bacterium]|nr:hypothetical protein [Clostridiaceae bacterium]